VHVVIAEVGTGAAEIAAAAAAQQDSAQGEREKKGWHR
jgi:hypothetical protein